MTFWDYAVFCAVLLLAGALVFFTLPKGAGREITITLDGEIYGTYPFEDREITVSSDRGENTISITEWGVRVENASCPDKLCVRKGEIKKAGETIVCLPNRVVVTILGEGRVDSTSY